MDNLSDQINVDELEEYCKDLDNENTIPQSESPTSQTQRNNKSKKNKNIKGPFSIEATLGEGAFAKVKLATHIQTQQKIAIKIISKAKLIKEEIDVSRIKREISILKKIKHKNIIHLYLIMESKNNLYIVMEYCEGKDLFEYITKKQLLKEKEACRLFQQIINGIEYLHQLGIIHRDLKPENILLDSNCNIKISDFGLSAFYSDDNLLETPCGTPSYAPPEMLRGEHYNGHSSDIWSCGIILYAMLCGRLPYSESKEDLLLQKIMNYEYTIPKFVSKSACDLINKMLMVDPKKRISIEQVIKHPWFHLVQAEMRPGLMLDRQNPPVDPFILNKVGEYGIDKEKCAENVSKNKFDSYTLIYYLLLKKHITNGGSSVSDLNSKEYIAYIEQCNKKNNNKNKNNINSNYNIEENSKLFGHQKKKSIDVSSSKLKLPYHLTISNKRSPSPCEKKVVNKIGKNIDISPANKIGIKSNLNNNNNNVKGFLINNNSTLLNSTIKQSHLAKQILYKKKRQERAKLKQRQTMKTSTPKSLTQKEIQMIENEDIQFEEDLNKVDLFSSDVCVIQYIAKKLMGSSFCGSFELALNSSKRGNPFLSIKTDNNNNNSNNKHNDSTVHVKNANESNWNKKINKKHSFIKTKEVCIFDKIKKDNSNNNRIKNTNNTSSNCIETSLEKQSTNSIFDDSKIIKGNTNRKIGVRSPFIVSNNNNKSGKLVQKNSVICEEVVKDEKIKFITNLVKKCKINSTNNLKEKDNLMGQRSIKVNNFFGNKNKKRTVNMINQKSEQYKITTVETTSSNKKKEITTKKSEEVQTEKISNSFPQKPKINL